VDQSKTAAAIPKLRNSKTCVHLLFSSSIRLRSSFNRGSSEGSAIKPVGGKSGLLVGLLLPSGGFYHQSSIFQAIKLDFPGKDWLKPRCRQFKIEIP
jgi:hypothetical protein